MVVHSSRSMFFSCIPQPGRCASSDSCEQPISMPLPIANHSFKTYLVWIPFEIVTMMKKVHRSLGVATNESNNLVVSTSFYVYIHVNLDIVSL